MITRRHELDWLRVLLFALLVPHHVAVGFVSWGVDIYGFVNDRTAGDLLGLFIYWSHSWRLPSLFLIAGIGTWFLTSRGVGARFMGRRLMRLGVPLLFGTFFVNVFGGYAMSVAQDADVDFPAFWWSWLTEPEFRQIQHLWFLVNLAVYTVLCWSVFLFRDRLSAMVPAPARTLALLVLASAMVVVLWKPHAAALTGENYQFGLYLLFFLGGYVVGADHVRMLDWTRRFAWWLLAAAIVLFLAKVTLLTMALLKDVPTGEALAEGGWAAAGLSPPNATAFSAVEAATAWAWCLAALGLAGRFLDRPGALLAELNRAVFPYYVLHFPVTLIVLAIASRVDW